MGFRSALVRKNMLNATNQTGFKGRIVWAKTGAHLPVEIYGAMMTNAIS